VAAEVTGRAVVPAPGRPSIRPTAEAACVAR
jgi:hypothetical protein